MHQYPTAAELDRMGECLRRDVNLCSDDLRAWFGRPHTSAVRTMAEPDPQPAGRIYASFYVGVARIKSRYVATWGPRGRCQGARRAMTPDGEFAAAVERARALGLDYVEKRDGSKVLIERAA
jgi:hypothetical protein